MLRRRLAPWAAALAIVATYAGCQGAPDLELCGEIPAGGCPIGRGGTCDDVTCAALYDCVEGKWTQVDLCPPENGGGGAGGEGGDAGVPACITTSLDAGSAGTCHPDLQVPDCPIEAAQGCPDSICLTGCIDFFGCSSDGWVPVAYCDDEGHIVTSP